MQDLPTLIKNIKENSILYKDEFIKLTYGFIACCDTFMLNKDVKSEENELEGNLQLPVSQFEWLEDLLEFISLTSQFYYGPKIKNSDQNESKKANLIDKNVLNQNILKYITHTNLKMIKTCSNSRKAARLPILSRLHRNGLISLSDYVRSVMNMGKVRLFSVGEEIVWGLQNIKKLDREKTSEEFKKYEKSFEEVIEILLDGLKSADSVNLDDESSLDIILNQKTRLYLLIYIFNFTQTSYERLPRAILNCLTVKALKTFVLDYLLGILPLKNEPKDQNSELKELQREIKRNKKESTKKKGFDYKTYRKEQNVRQIIKNETRDEKFNENKPRIGIDLAKTDELLGLKSSDCVDTPFAAEIDNKIQELILLLDKTQKDSLKKILEHGARSDKDRIIRIKQVRAYVVVNKVKEDLKSDEKDTFHFKNDEEQNFIEKTNKSTQNRSFLYNSTHLSEYSRKLTLNPLKSTSLSRMLMNMADLSKQDLPAILNTLGQSVTKGEVPLLVNWIGRTFVNIKTKNVRNSKKVINQIDSDLVCYGLRLLTEIVIRFRTENIIEKVNEIISDLNINKVSKIRKITKTKKNKNKAEEKESRFNILSNKSKDTGTGLFYTHAALIRAIKYGTTDKNSVMYYMARKGNKINE